MDFAKLATHRVRGQALTESLLVVLLLAVVVGALAYVLGRVGTYWATGRTQAAIENSASVLTTELYRDGASAQAALIPAADVANQSNADGHEIAFYQLDSAHVGHFYSYCFKATASDCGAGQALNTLQRYSYSWNELPQHGGAGAHPQASAVTTLAGFSARVLTTQAQYQDATQNPAAAAYFARHSFTFSSIKTYRWGYPGVTSSSNALYVVTFQLPNNDQRSIAIGKHRIVVAEQVLYGTATPTPNPIKIGGASSASLTFARPCCVGSQNATVTESNYGTRTTTPPQVYTFDNGCASVATYNPTSPVTPSSDGTGTAVITLLPIKQIASSGLACTLTGVDNVNQPVTINVTVGQTFAPTIGSAPAAGVNGQTGTITVLESNYDKAASGGGFPSVSGGSACSTPSLTNESVDASNHYTATYSVNYIATGVCTASFTDTYGQTVSTNINVASASGPLSVWPPAVELPVSGGALGTLAYDGKPRDAGAWINALLGGGIAEASVSGCSAGQGRAFKDGTDWTSANVLANAQDPWGGGLTTDSNGCISGAGGANVVAHEPGYNGAFNFQPLSCGGLVSNGPWSGSGPTASTKTAGASVVTCRAQVQDNNAQPQTQPVAVKVSNAQLFPCQRGFQGCYVIQVNDAAMQGPNCQVGLDRCIDYAGSPLLVGPDGALTRPTTPGWTQGKWSWSDANGNVAAGQIYTTNAPGGTPTNYTFGAYNSVGPAYNYYLPYGAGFADCLDQQLAYATRWVDNAGDSAGDQGPVSQVWYGVFVPDSDPSGYLPLLGGAPCEY